MRFSEKEEYLRKKDKKLKKIIDANGHIVFKSNKNYQFDILVGIVISQFISTKASSAIFLNIKNFFNKDHLNEKDFQKLSINDIKHLGLSTSKAKTIKKLSELYLSKNFGDLTKISHKNMNDKLLSVFGIGPWSVNMFEIFCIGNPDVFSSKDAGLRMAMNKAGFIESNSEWNEYDDYARKWSPYRSIACVHLWKTVD